MYYVNTAVLANDVKSFSLAVDALYELIEKAAGSFDKVAAPLGKGSALVPPLAMRLDKPFALIASDGVVMGSISAGERVVLVDDVISTGKTLAACAKYIKDEGAVAMGAFVLIDRREGGGKTLSEIGVNLTAVLPIDKLAETLYSLGFISEEERDVLLGEA